MTNQEAAMLVKRLLGSYPSLNLHDPKVYIAECTAVFKRVPQAVGEAALRIARTASPTFVPSTAAVEDAVKQALDAMPSQTVYRSAWDDRTQRQLEERAEIENNPRPSPGFLERMRREMAAHGMHTLGSKPNGERLDPGHVMANLGLSREQWDALPDQPKNATCWKQAGEQ